MAKKGKQVRKASPETAKRVKALAKLVPSLRKYSRRKTFSRGEKSAITRAHNIVAKIMRGGNTNIVPVSKKVAKKARNNVIGSIHGGPRIQGVTVPFGVDPGDVKFSKGHLTFTIRDKDWITWPVNFAQPADRIVSDLEATKAEIRAHYAGKDPFSFISAMWTVRGPVKANISLDAVTDAIEAEINAYSMIVSAQDQAIFMGLATRDA